MQSVFTANSFALLAGGTVKLQLRFSLDFLATVYCLEQNVYAHVWQPGDIVFWDNSQVMHTGMPYDATKYQRIALRVGVVNY